MCIFDGLENLLEQIRAKIENNFFHQEIAFMLLHFKSLKDFFLCIEITKEKNY